MIVLAVVLLVLAAALSVLVILDGGQGVNLDLIFGAQLDTSVTGIFVAGLVLGAIALGSIGFLWIGLRRDLRHRREVKELKRRAAENEHHEPTPAVSDGHQPDHHRDRAHDHHADHVEDRPLTEPAPSQDTGTGFSAPDARRSDPLR